MAPIPGKIYFVVETSTCYIYYDNLWYPCGVNKQYIDSILKNMVSIESAEIGQAIVVKSIDENGKPNEYEAKSIQSLESFEEADPTVPAWAKTANKPTYTAAEVGAATVTNIYNITPYMTNRDFSSGTYIITSIPASETHGAPFYLTIEGNTYTRGYPVKAYIQGYLWNNSIINYGGLTEGPGISQIVAFCNTDGYLSFWFERQGYWEGYNIYCFNAYETIGKGATNRVTSVTDSSMPSGTKITYINLYMSLNSINFLNYIYPVGSVYISLSSTSPASLFGGTWERLIDRFLIGAGSSYSVGATGGSATHTLSLSEIPSHDGHLYSLSNWANGTLASRFLNYSSMSSYGSTARGWSLNAANEAVPASHAKGGSGAHNNLPPYLAVYMWKRIG